MYSHTLERDILFDVLVRRLALLSRKSFDVPVCRLVLLSRKTFDALERRLDAKGLIET